MRRVTSTIVLVAALFAPVGPAHAGTDQETFAKLIAKVAPDALGLIQGKFKPKLACACPVSPGPAVAGIVATDPLGNIRCAIPGFDADGAVAVFAYCNDFAVLGR